MFENIMESKIIPFVPYFCRDGNKIVKEWQEQFTDPTGNSGTICLVIFTNKKGEESPPTTRWIKWDVPKSTQNPTNTFEHGHSWMQALPLKENKIACGNCGFICKISDLHTINEKCANLT